MKNQYSKAPDLGSPKPWSLSNKNEHYAQNERLRLRAIQDQEGAVTNDTEKHEMPDPFFLRWKGEST
ncbi:hypothetical protein SUGI_0623920 [Cryptomeria japonica]|nr:hypothetical protein SUGI_0623920 [Cryptomeria japonica]